MDTFSPKQLALFRTLSTPAKVQDFLNTFPFNFEEKGETCTSPLRTLESKKAHCLEGALLALAVLQSHRIPSFLVDLKSTRDDFDHIIVVFKKNGHIGAISKTNHVVLRYREPIYKTLRELIMTYFHEYFLNDGTKTLKSYSRPVHSKEFQKDWQTTDEDLWDIGALLDDVPHTSILPSKKFTLRKADKVEIEAGKIVEWKRQK